MIVVVIGSGRGSEEGSRAASNDESAFRTSSSDEMKLSKLDGAARCPSEYSEACRAFA